MDSWEDTFFSQAALDNALTILELMLSTALALLTFGLAFVEKIAGPEVLKRWSVRAAFVLLLLSLPLLVLCMSWTVTTACGLGEPGKGLVYGSGVSGEMMRTDALRSWADLKRWSKVAYLTWMSGVFVLIVSVAMELWRRGRRKERTHAWDFWD